MRNLHHVCVDKPCEYGGLKLALNPTEAELIKNKLEKIKPKKGLIQLLTITENQYNKMETILGESQTNVVNVFRLIIKDTIEERIIQLQKEKSNLADRILSGEGVSSATLSRQDLLELLINEEKIKEEFRKKKKPIERNSIDIEYIKKEDLLTLVTKAIEDDVFEQNKILVSIAFTPQAARLSRHPAAPAQGLPQREIKR